MCMKKYYLLIFIISTQHIIAQIPEDAIKYSWLPQTGTARNRAIGGAMGSLGGDLTAVFVNPAGLAFYRNNEALLSAGFLNTSNSSIYLDSKTDAQKSTLNFGPSGFIVAIPNKQNPKNNSALSIAFSQTASFNQQIRYSASNNYSSFSEQFSEEFAKSNLSIGDVLSSNSTLPYTVAPALYTYLIDTATINGILQVKAAPEYLLDSGKAVFQQMSKTQRGGIYELAIAYASSIKEKFLYGFTLGIPIVSYNSEMVFSETDPSGDTSNRFHSFTYTDKYKTTGAGVNLKFGCIYRPREYIRIGMAIHTPSMLQLTDTRTTYLSTSLENPIKKYEVSSKTFTNNQKGESSYYQYTPWKMILSGSYVFREIENIKKQRGFITADIEYLQQGGSRFSSNNEAPSDNEKSYYNSLNKVIKNQYKGTVNFRLGGEIKFNIIMARLGFAYYSNPYKASSFKASQTLFSGGLGYRDKGFFIDLTYVYLIKKDADVPYRLEDRESIFAAVNQNRGNIVATFGIKF